MSFNELTAYTQKVADAADTIVGNAPLAKSIFDAAPEELRSYFNNLVDALKSTASGDSGAKNTGATSIQGLTGTDVQTLLESLKTYIDGLKGITWQGMSGFNNWQNYGDPFNALQCGKDGYNFVHVRGCVKLGSQGSKITELPTGMKPLKGYRFSCPTLSGQVNINVSASGDISLDPNTNYTDHIFLDLPPFLGEQ